MSGWLPKALEALGFTTPIIYAVVAYGCASINGDSLVPLCEACFVADSTTSIVRKFLNARTQGSQKAGM